MTYYNTTNQEGETLKRNTKKAETQNERILAYFKNRPGIMISPTDVWIKLFDRQVPLTSVRRGITVLTNEGSLEKTTFTKYGTYGRKEYCWTLKTEK